MTDNYFIIHGSYGNPYKNWIPWLKKELAKRKKNCIVPSFPTPYKQDYESWSKILKSYFDIGTITETTTFITHSLGCIFIVKFLIEYKIKVGRIITIAGFNNFVFEDDRNLYETFYIENRKLGELKEYCPIRISFYSDDDPYVPEKEAVFFSENIESQKIFIRGAGHFNEKSGYTEFLELLKYLGR